MLFYVGCSPDVFRQQAEVLAPAGGEQPVHSGLDD